MRIIVQQRLGLPLDEALASGEPTCTARGARVQDPTYGWAIRRAISGAPATTNATRQCCGSIMQGVWDTLVEMEPQDHLRYSNDYRPDISGQGLGKARTRLICLFVCLFVYICLCVCLCSTYEAPTREYTHKHTQTQTNTQRAPPLLIRGERLAPSTPSKLHLCRYLPRRSYVHRHRQALC